MVHSSASPEVFPAPLSVHLTLLVPELIWPEPADEHALGKLAAPGLEWVLARARSERSARRPFEKVLADCFGMANAPFGALRLLGEGAEEARSGHWLCADPVHLRFYQERIILADAGAFDLEEDEAQGLVEALNAEYGDVGQFHAASARRWYLRLNVPVDHPAEPISAVAGRRVDGELNGSALPLTRWLNEVQMFLHGHPVNERRETAGQPAINSLWLWGGGTLPTAAAPEFLRRLQRQSARRRPRPRRRHSAARPAGQSRRPASREPASGRWSCSTSCCRASSSEDGEGWRSDLSNNSTPTGSRRSKKPSAARSTASA